MLKTPFGNSAKDSRKKNKLLCRKMDYRGQLKRVKVQPGANGPRSPSRLSVNSGPGSNSAAYLYFLFVYAFLSTEKHLILSRGEVLQVCGIEKEKKSEVPRSEALGPEFAFYTEMKS